MKHDTAYALALELDAQCLRIAGDMQGAASLQSKADAIRAGTYQEPTPQDTTIALQQTLDRLHAMPVMQDCARCGRIAHVLTEDEYLCHRCANRPLWR